MSIPEDDVELVAQRCDVGRDSARRALRCEDGDLAAAIARIEDSDMSAHEELTEKSHRASADIPEADVDLVAQRTDVPPAKAHDVLQEKNGDLAGAVEALTQECSSDQHSTANTSTRATEQSTDESTTVYRSPASNDDDSPTTVYSPDSATAGESPRASWEYCPQCGTEIKQPDVENFCSNCGTELE